MRSLDYTDAWWRDRGLIRPTGPNVNPGVPKPRPDRERLTEAAVSGKPNDKAEALWLHAKATPGAFAAAKADNRLKALAARGGPCEGCGAERFECACDEAPGR